VPNLDKAKCSTKKNGAIKSYAAITH